MSDKFTGDVPRKGRPAADAIRLTPGRGPRPIGLDVSAGDGALIEFVVLARDDTANRPMAPFLVEAADSAQARVIALRKWLTLISVEPFVPKPGEQRPRLLRFGPPISPNADDRDPGEWGAEGKPSGSGVPFWWLFLAIFFLAGFLRAMARLPGLP